MEKVGMFVPKMHGANELVTMGVKVPYHMKKKLQVIAEDQERSLANMIHYILKRYIQDYDADFKV